MRMMADLADHYGADPVFLKDIAKREDISEKYLSLIVIPLRGAGLVQSIRGAKGGYRLTRKPEDITVRDVWQAVEGEICLVDCVKDTKRCARISTCPTRDIWSMLGQKISETLKSITLADLVRTRHEKADNNMMSNI